jgi:group I intron endonuclease
MAYVYQTINLVNNKKYIGFCSKTPAESTLYLGSGVMLARAINKYGIENFKKEIIKEFDNELEARLFEEQYISSVNAVDSNEYYNLTKGGFGGFSKLAKERQRSLETRAKISAANTGRLVSDKTRKILSEKLKGTKPWNTGKERSIETKEKLSKALKGKPITQEHRENISKAQKGRVYKKCVCIHCGKVGGVNVMQKWHFNNCKYKK